MQRKKAEGCVYANIATHEIFPKPLSLLGALLLEVSYYYVPGRNIISDGALSVILCSVRYIPKRGSRMIAQCPSPHFYSNILDVAQKAGETAAYYFVKVILLRSRIVSRPLSAGLSAGKASSGIAEGVWLALGYTVEFWAY